MSDLSLKSRISRRTDVLTADMTDGEMVMLHIDRGMYYGMQTVAAFIWNLLDRPRSIAEVSDEVVSHFGGVERRQCQQDVLAFIGDLEQEELIHVHDATAA